MDQLGELRSAELAHVWNHSQQQMQTPPPSVSTSSDTDDRDLRTVPLPYSSITRLLLIAETTALESDTSDYAPGHSEDDCTIASADEDDVAIWDSDN